MDRGAWRATVHEVTRVRQDLATKPPYNFKHLLYAFQLLIFVLNITDMILAKKKKNELIQQFVGDRFFKKISKVWSN